MKESIAMCFLIIYFANLEFATGIYQYLNLFRFICRIFMRQSFLFQTKGLFGLSKTQLERMKYLLVPIKKYTIRTVDESIALFPQALRGSYSPIKRAFIRSHHYKNQALSSH